MVLWGGEAARSAKVLVLFSKSDGFMKGRPRWGTICNHFSAHFCLVKTPSIATWDQKKLKIMKTQFFTGSLTSAEPKGMPTSQKWVPTYTKKSSKRQPRAHKTDSEENNPSKYGKKRVTHMGTHKKTRHLLANLGRTLFSWTLIPHITIEGVLTRQKCAEKWWATFWAPGLQFSVSPNSQILNCHDFQ